MLVGIKISRPPIFMGPLRRLFLRASIGPHLIHSKTETDESQRRDAALGSLHAPEGRQSSVTATSLDRAVPLPIVSVRHAPRSPKWMKRSSTFRWARLVRRNAITPFGHACRDLRIATPWDCRHATEGTRGDEFLLVMIASAKFLVRRRRLALFDGSNFLECNSSVPGTPSKSLIESVSGVAQLENVG